VLVYGNQFRPGEWLNHVGFVQTALQEMSNGFAENYIRLIRMAMVEAALNRIRHSHGGGNLL
jgi:anti-sigma regulatory factor (Ser/Thr protein kinase)